MTRAESADSGTASLQFVGGGAIPTSALHIRPIPWTVGRQFIRQHHYLHHAPPVGMLALGIFDSAEPLARLVGAMLWNNPAARMEQCDTTMELRRMFILDCTERNAESRALAVASRYIRTNFPHITRLLAYADPAAGHEGIIYRGAGWRLVGTTSGSGGATNVNTLRPGRNLILPSKKNKYEKVLL